MRPSLLASHARTRRRLAAGAVAGAMLLTACGGSSGNNAAETPVAESLPAASVDADQSTDDAPATDAAQTDGSTNATQAAESSVATDAADTGESTETPEISDAAEISDSAESGEPTQAPAAEPVAPNAVEAGFVDLVGPDVLATSELETNMLPSVVVDDLTTDRKVNFRNLVPQDKPILLWMWAPH